MPPRLSLLVLAAPVNISSVLLLPFPLVYTVPPPTVVLVVVMVVGVFVVFIILLPRDGEQAGMATVGRGRNSLIIIIK